VLAEPDVHQPVAFTFDAKGRLWLAEAFTYPKRADGDWHAGADDVVVFEDRDGDGAYETRTVFLDHLNLVSGLEVGFGGVWIGAAPYLLFVPDADGDLVPDAAPEVVLDGFGYQDTHETLNAFTWGPDGWLYGCHGVFTHSRVGKPGTPPPAASPAAPAQPAGKPPEEKAREDREQEAERQAQCANARSIVERLETRPASRYRREDGSYQRYSDEERERMIREARDFEARHCR